jgi:hypothetical protein
VPQRALTSNMDLMKMVDELECCLYDFREEDNSIQSSESHNLRDAEVLLVKLIDRVREIRKSS